MNERAFEKIKELLDAAGALYQVYEHEICRTSEESARVRKTAGIPEAIGVKALLCKVDFVGSPSEFIVFVLPGTHTLDKAAIKINIPGFKQFRFATPEELMDIAGVVPGCMPPFGNQIFEKISRLYISSKLKDFERVAFNAAKLDASITLLTEDYLKAVKPDAMFEFSRMKE
jgi:Ala-tRNA(Pro) deacylase